MDLIISETQIRKSVQHGGALFSSLFNLGARLLPKVTPIATKFASKILPGLSSGILSCLGNFGMDKILGKGQSGGFIIPQNKIDKLIAHKNLLTKSKQQQILSALQTGGNLGSLLASIGIPLLLNALTGKGLLNRKPKGKGLKNRPPPFIG